MYKKDGMLFCVIYECIGLPCLCLFLFACLRLFDVFCLFCLLVYSCVRYVSSCFAVPHDFCMCVLLLLLCCFCVCVFSLSCACVVLFLPVWFVD